MTSQKKSSKVQPKDHDMVTPANPIQISNYYGNLDDNVDLNDQAPIPSTSIKAKKSNIAIASSIEENKMKPIIVLSTTHNTMMNLGKTIGVKISTRKMKAANSYMVLTSNTKDKTKFIEALKNRQLQFHTYSEPQERQSEFILKNFEMMSTEEVKTKQSFSNQQECQLPSLQSLL
jgi:hypothetical protein